MVARYERIAERYAQRIHGGLLAPGERLPSLRLLCEKEGVSLMTALAAYRRLEALRLVEAAPRSGFKVSLSVSPKLDRPAIRRARLVHDRSPREAILAQALAAAADPALAPLGLASPDPAHFPLASLRRITGRLLAARPEIWGTYSLPPGHPELRGLIARRLSARGLRVGPDNILITGGAMEALSLSIRCAARSPALVAVECPTYFGILDAIRSAGADVLELPGDPEHGVDPARLDDACRRHRVSAAVLMACFANPTGSRMSEEHKAALASVLERHRVALVEDDLYSELAFDGRAPSPLASHIGARAKAPWFLAGSFSKTLLPAGRVGYLVADAAFVEQAMVHKRMTTLANPTLPELLATECLATGVYDRHLRRMIPRLRQQMRLLEHAVASHFPAGTKASRPAGGFMSWVELPRGADGERLFWSARDAGISIIPGSVFSLS
ncbi:MAG TPA: PLP-dependent aminotransferase family protein, partial [Polyangiaceae bacterium]|nr:PLP-dependent aminotransferase family protein [Polyangiaceae bacterium]